MKKYRLLKDLPNVKAGATFLLSRSSSNIYFYGMPISNEAPESDQVGIVRFEKSDVENNPDWFEPIEEKGLEFVVRRAILNRDKFTIDCIFESDTRDEAERLKSLLEALTGLSKEDVEKVIYALDGETPLSSWQRAEYLKPTFQRIFELMEGGEK